MNISEAFKMYRNMTGLADLKEFSLCVGLVIYNSVVGVMTIAEHIAG